ncbi:MAG: ATP-binding cassette domain-containing protein [Rhodospirillaceae bacterium]|nr:ATP-binding cassette domain-containing protein [Rhodospirillaceae bacterium]MBT4691071.1 ATP-binding cassette domain-containing protein [Rhodospirillaceae bacterium]MBT5080656.1 ATP-binding cassette domain-containing protein [Rhodospirillaceae bacterium]MBT5525084.1 ATP-binding cassette domain-containing protein [Rhodospirillaceae bacterium]MBT5878054.1 ATP-binding cassette domain-containing protein [Rhodospirillaceae bacterium]
MDTLRANRGCVVNSNDIMINLKDVHLTLPSEAGPVDILRGVSLSVPKGEAIGLVGPSGSGKSTMMAVIAGLERASHGEVQVAGHSLQDMGEDALALFRRDNVGIVFQSFHLIPTMTALENVAMPLEFAGVADAFAGAEAALADVGLEHRLTHYPAQLSGGEQQRVALARAVVRRPALLLADEPTGNLDGATGSAIIELMFRLHAAVNSTLILITHDPALAERCDRIMHMRDGLLDDTATLAAD